MNKRQGHPAEHGFTLIETLVAIFILALGATGVAAMQLNALRMAQQSGFQSQAAQFAAELAELIRDDTQPAAANSALHEWQQRVQRSLPQGRAVICRDSRPVIADTADTLRWDCDQAGDSALVVKIGWSAKEKTPAGKTTATAEAPPGIVMAVGL